MSGIVEIDYKAGGTDAVLRALKSIAQAASEASRTLARESTRASQTAVTAEQRAAKDIVSRAQATAREVIAAKRQETRELERIERDYHTRVRQERRQALQEEIGAARTRRATRQAVVETAGRSLGRTAGTLAAVGGLAAGGLSLATVANAGREELDMGRRAALLQNRSRIKDVDFTARARGLSNLTGESVGDVMGAFEKITAKGGGSALGGVLGRPEVLENLIKQAKGAGVTFEDLGDVIATLSNRGVAIEDMPKTFASLVEQGKDAAVEMKDLASKLDASTGALLRFKMTAEERTLAASGLTQMARTFGRASASQATSAVVDFGRDLGSKGDLIQALTGGKVTGYRTIGGKRSKVIKGGVEIGTDASRSELKNLNMLIPKIIDETFKHGNADKLTGEGGVFTGTSTTIGMPAIEAYQKGITKNTSGRYMLTEEGQTADLKGIDAVNAMLAQFQAAGADPAKGIKDFDNAMNTGSEKLKLAMTRLTNQLGEQLGNKITNNIDTIATRIGQAGTGLAWVIDHPIKSAMLLAGANLAKDLGGKLLSMGLERLLVGQKVGVVNMQAAMVNMAGGASAASQVAGSATPLLAAGGQVLAAAAAGATAGYFTAEAGNKDVDQADDAATRRRKEAAALTAKLNAGRASPAEAARARALRGEIQSDRGGALGAMKLYGEGIIAPYTGLAKGDYSAGNIAGAAMPALGLLRGAYDATLGTQAAGQRQGQNELSAKALSDALDKPLKLAPGTSVTMANAADFGAAIGEAAGRAMNANNPKAQHHD